MFFTHDIPHIVNLMLCIANGILLACIRGAVANHDRLEGGIERRTPITRQIRKVRLGGRILLEELLLDLD